jgi:uncharacterized protein YjiS (DUF1127 family)
MTHILKLITHIATRFEQYHIYNKTVDDLSKLSDRELKDIGIHRGMIRSVAMEVYSNAK